MTTRANVPIFHPNLC